MIEGKEKGKGINKLDKERKRMKKKNEAEKGNQKSKGVHQ
jgi:hypothetical protein